MNLLPKTKEEFSRTDYWDSFFRNRGSKSFEWYLVLLIPYILNMLYLMF